MLERNNIFFATEVPHKVRGDLIYQGSAQENRHKQLRKMIKELKRE